MSQPPKRLPSPDVAGNMDPRPLRKRSRKHLVHSEADDVVRATSIRVKTNTGRVSMRRLKGTTRDVQNADHPGLSTVSAAPGLTGKRPNPLQAKHC